MSASATHSDTTQRLAQSGDAARAAIAEAMYQDRKMLALGGWLIAALAIALLAITVLVRGVASPWQLAVWSLGVGAIVVLAAMLHTAGRDRLYGIMLAWVALIHLFIAAQLANFYFGVERALILKGTSPVLMLAVPVAIIGARSMLKAADATRLNLALIAAMLLIIGLHALLYWNQAETHYAMLLMFATAGIAAPLCELLMRQHFRLQFSAEQSLRAALTEARHEALEAERRTLLDPVTELMSRQGIQQSLDAALIDNKMTGIAQFSISNLAGLREKHPSLDPLLQRLAAELRQASGPEYRLGRMDGGDFHLWGRCDEPEAAWEARCLAIAAQASAAMRETGLPVSLSCGAGLYPQRHDRAFALEDVSFRCFMNSVRD